MSPLTYTPAPLHRATHLRGDAARIAALLTGGAARIVPVWNERHLLGEGPNLLALDYAAASRFDLSGLVFLGIGDGTPWFALRLPSSEIPPDVGVPGAFRALNEYVSVLTGDEAAILAYARAMLLWHRNHLHCGRCGAPTQATEAGHSSTCTACGHRTYPRTDPVVITLITHADQCLLGRKAEWPSGMFSCIAGFVEPGETLESAVRRECAEETGAGIDDVRYVASQPWPFPASMMLGFRARATSLELGNRDDELADVRWFARAQVRAFGERSDPGDGFKLPNRYAISRHLIEGWLAE